MHTAVRACDTASLASKRTSGLPASGMSLENKTPLLSPRLPAWVLDRSWRAAQRHEGVVWAAAECGIKASRVQTMREKEKQRRDGPMAPVNRHVSRGSRDEMKTKTCWRRHPRPVRTGVLSLIKMSQAQRSATSGFKLKLCHLLTENFSASRILQLHLVLYTRKCEVWSNKWDAVFLS